MARKNRNIFEGAIYHVYQRGNNREYIFGNSSHKAFLLKQIKECNKAFDFQLLAYVIMNNHYHLMIKANKTTISEIMFHINNVLGKYLNRELNRTGHVFESRYNSKLVDNEAYLVWLLRYIHRNPVRANICVTPDEYRWSSHYFYENGINKFVNTDFILKIMSSDKKTAIMQYKNLVEVNGENDFKADFEKTKNDFKLNDSRKQYKEEEVFICGNKTLQEILYLMDLDSQTKELLIGGSKKRNMTPYKIIFIKEAIENKHTLKEIGLFLNTSQPAISNLLAYYRA